MIEYVSRQVWLLASRICFLLFFSFLVEMPRVCESLRLLCFSLLRDCEALDAKSGGY